MPLPNTDELDTAYEEGRDALPGAKNPYHFGTGLWMQWNFGRADSHAMQPAADPRRFTRFTKFAARMFLCVAVATMALALVRGTLL